MNQIRNIHNHIKTYQLVHTVPSGDADISIVAFPKAGLTTADEAKAKNCGSLLK